MDQETTKMPWSAQQTIWNLKVIKACCLGLVKGEQEAEEVAFDFDRAIAALERMERAVNSRCLKSWYVNSASQDDEPVWTEAHIKKLCNDFILIPKAVEK